MLYQILKVWYCQSLEWCTASLHVIYCGLHRPGALAIILGDHHHTVAVHIGSSDSKG